ncbi:MAG TPA: aldehyde dehydrogenase family protein, partial [Microthrixaceae bacterium]|nr:aldehyde dehydrogenase family protein [Microthrixaceae bacterium]
MAFPQPGGEASPIKLKSRYEHYIGGAWVPPANGLYFENPSPVDGKVFCEVARGTAADVEAALDAAHGARATWGATSPAERSAALLAIAQKMEDHLEELAVVETWENGKPVRETLAADLPLAIDHFRYFAGVLRAEEGGISQLDDTTVAYHFKEP